MVKIRLMRMGATKRPFYRVVVADSRSPRDGRFIENIGKYHPLEDPSLIEIDEDRAMYWLTEGAQPTEQARALLKIQGIWARFESERPGTAKKKAPSAGAGAKKPAAAAKDGGSGDSSAGESAARSDSDGAAS
jgi:small subunit ribosomal protein S16